MNKDIQMRNSVKEVGNDNQYEIIRPADKPKGSHHGDAMLRR